MPNQDEYFGNLALKNFQELTIPDTTHWWPLAPGWTVLATILALLFLWRIFIMIKTYKANAYRRRALARLEQINSDYDQAHIDPKNYLLQLRNILKATALIVYQRNEVASLNGQKWLEFLNTKTRKKVFSDDADFFMENELYKQHYEPDKRRLKLFSKSVAQWLAQHD